MEVQFQKRFTVDSLKRERSIISNCATSVCTRLEDLMFRLKESNYEKEGLEYDKMFLQKTCEREKDILTMFFTQTFKSIDECVRVLDDVEIITPTGERLLTIV